MYNPKLFIRVNDPSRSEINNLCNEFRTELDKISGRCIDIGSATADGTVDFLYPKLNPKATLVCSDISEPMVEFAKERYGKDPRLSFMKLDIQSPKLNKALVEQFDCVTSFYCFHMCHDVRQVYKNVFDLLRPGGTSITFFIGRWSGFEAYRELATMPRYQPYMKDAENYVPIFQQGEDPRTSLKALLDEVGFEVLHCSFREKTYVYKDLETSREFYLAANPFTERIPLNLREEFSMDLAEEVAKRCIVFKNNNNANDSHSILSIYHLFVVHVRKPLAK